MRHPPGAIRTLVDLLQLLNRNETMTVYTVDASGHVRPHDLKWHPQFVAVAYYNDGNVIGTKLQDERHRTLFFANDFHLGSRSYNRNFVFQHARDAEAYSRNNWK